MKKLLCVLLSVLMMLSSVALVACNGTEDETEKETTGTTTEAESVKMGLGIYVTASATNASADANGKGTADVTVAAITVDKDGKIVALALDALSAPLAYTLDGKAVANDSFKTKYELGFDYNMVNFGAAEKEWFEQVDAFKALVIGKTQSEVKALALDTNYGSEDVIAAGCTIKVNELVLAIDKAFANLADSNATTASALKLGINVDQTTADATADKAGNNQIDVTAFAAATDKDGKVLTAKTDCLQVKFGFDTTGTSTFDATKALETKRELGFDYNMVNFGAAEKEWFEQADIFESLCVGKTAAEIVALCADTGYGTDAVKTAGCTVLVDGFTKAADKID